MAKVVLILFLVALCLVDMGEAGCQTVCGCHLECRWKRSAVEPTEENFFKTIDADGDSFLTVEEWHAQRNSVKQFAKLLESMDEDGDERISWDEFQQLEHCEAQ